MKWILSLLMLVSLASFGQTDDSTKYIWYKFQYGSRMPRFWADSSQRIPYGDTALFAKPQKPGNIMMHTDKDVYRWDGIGWSDLQKNIANSSLHANGDYVQHWNQHYLILDSIGPFGLTSIGFYNTLDVWQRFQIVGQADGPFGSIISHAVRKVDNTADSARNTLVLGANTGRTASLASTNVANNKSALLELSGGSTNASTADLIADSVRISAIPKSTADSIPAFGPYNPATKTRAIYAVPVSGVGGVVDTVNYISTHTKLRDSTTAVRLALTDSTRAFTTVEQTEINVDSNIVIGDIYNKTSWANLSDFETNSGFAASGGIITSSGSGGYIRLPEPTMLDNSTIEISYKYTSHNSSNFGFAIAYESINPTGQSHASLFLTLNTHIGSDYLKLNTIQVYGVTATNHVSPSAITSFAVGDSLTLRLSYASGVTTSYIKNWRTGEELSYSINTDYLGTTGVEHNTAKVGLFNNGDAYQIFHIKYSSNAPKGAKLVTVGNSITAGAFAGSATNRYASLIKSVISAGSGDVTLSALSHLKEIYTYLQPKNAFLMIGGNDLAFGVSSGTWQAQLTAIHDTLVAHGVNAYFLLATPRDAIDVTPLNNFIMSTWPTKYIDTYTPLKGAGTDLSNTYDGGDGIHPNTAGHALIASTIMNSAIYQSISESMYLQYREDPNFSSDDNNAIVNVGFLKSFFAGTAYTFSSGLTNTNNVVTNNLITGMPSGQTIKGGTISGDNLTITSTGGIGKGKILLGASSAFDEANNRLGISTNAPAYRLDMGGYVTTNAHAKMGDLFFQSYNNANNFISQNAYSDGTYKYAAAGKAYILAFSNGIFLGNAVSGAANGAITWNNGILLNDANNVMIGTATDNGVGKLQVNGKATIATMDSAATPANMLWQDPSTKEIKKAAVPGNAYTTYAALLTQTGTSAPTATVLGTNGIGAIVWTRNSAGNYTGTLTGAFPANKTWFVAQSSSLGKVAASLSRASDNTITLIVYGEESGVLIAEDDFDNISVEIRIYP